MAEKQYTAQTNSVLIQQQMLANQQAQAAQQTPHSPGKPSRASDIILKKPRRKQGRESSDPVPVFCRISMKPKEHYLYD